jgi:TolB-like protein
LLLVITTGVALVTGDSWAAEKGKPVKGPTLLVFDLVAEQGVNKSVANMLTEIVIDRVTRTKKYEVIGQKDLDKMLFWEQNKQLKGCTDTQCLVEIAGAMGAEFYIEGSVGAMGGQYLVTLKYIHASRASVLERATRTIEQDEKVLMRTVGEMVGEVLGGPKGGGPETGFNWLLAGGYTAAAIGLGGVGAGVYFHLEANSVYDRLVANEEPDVKAAVDRGEDLKTYRLMSFIGGGVLAAAGATMLVFGYSGGSDGGVAVDFTNDSPMLTYGARF